MPARDRDPSLALRMTTSQLLLGCICRMHLVVAFEGGEVGLELPLEPGALVLLEPVPAAGGRRQPDDAVRRARGDRFGRGPVSPEALPRQEGVLEGVADQPLQLRVVEAVRLDRKL